MRRGSKASEAFFFVKVMRPGSQLPQGRRLPTYRWIPWHCLAKKYLYIFTPVNNSRVTSLCAPLRQALYLSEGSPPGLTQAIHTAQVHHMLPGYTEAGSLGSVIGSCLDWRTGKKLRCLTTEEFYVNYGRAIWWLGNYAALENDVYNKGKYSW